MKKDILIAFLAGALLFSGCSSVGNTARDSNSAADQNERPEGSVSDENNYYRSLADFLRHVPGVIVSGPDTNAIVTVRGANSINAGVAPLFVVDGYAVGNSYYHVNNMLNPNDIDYIRVLKGPDAAIYGVRGANGVVEIVTKN